MATALTFSASDLNRTKACMRSTDKRVRALPPNYSLALCSTPNVGVMVDPRFITGISHL